MALAQGLFVASDENSVAAAISDVVRHYRDHASQLKTFFETYSPKGDEKGEKPYLHQLQEIANGERRVLNVKLRDVDDYFSKADGLKVDPTLPAKLKHNVVRYTRLAYEAAEAIRESLPCEDPSKQMSMEMERAGGRLSLMRQANVPTHLRAPYEILFEPTLDPDSPPLTVRDLRGAHMGAITLLEGEVTRVGAVRPRISVAYYKCTECQTDVMQAVEGGTFLPFLFCQPCHEQKRYGELRFLLQDSKFVKSQDVRLQEVANRVPAGCVPRSTILSVEGSLTRQLLPGMRVIVGGVLLPKPVNPSAAFSRGRGYNGLGMVTEAVYKVMYIKHLKERLTTKQLTSATNQQLLATLKNDPNLYERVAKSIAPGIHGHVDVKKALLLQLIGGVHTRLPDGGQLRGDIHILLMGDPGVAKSQLLSQVCRLASRAHYATGKGSSGVGLTAAVVRDSATGDLTLEGGAIVLSDRGLCCIDEFDKMDELDRTAIHEVMEQQTVSISKAGLTATLNARTSILAAANPQYGRYDVKKSPMMNVNLPAALLSRFDVVFLLLDKADVKNDAELARYVLKLQQRGTKSATSSSGGDVLPEEVIRLIIAEAKQFEPRVDSDLLSEVVEHYVQMRLKERKSRTKATSQLFSYTTPRTLLGILRLAQAHARMRFSHTLDRGDFEEALRITAESRRSIEEEVESGRRGGGGDNCESDIIEILKRVDEKGGVWMKVVDLEELVCGKRNFSRSQLLKTLAAYEELGVLQWKDDTQKEIAFTERLEEA